MKHKFFSIMLVISLLFTTFIANAVSIEFEDLEQSEDLDSKQNEEVLEISNEQETELNINEENSEIQSETIFVDEEVQTFSLEATNNEIMTTALETQTVTFGNILTVPSHGCGSSAKSWSSSEYSLNVLGEGDLYFTVGGINCGSNIDYAGMYVYDTDGNLITSKTRKPTGKYGGGSYNKGTLSIHLTKGDYIIKAISNHPHSCSASIRVYANVLNVHFSGTYEANANYTIKHYKQNLDESYMLEESITNTETVGASVTPEVKTYEGFTSPQPITKTVLADGSTVIEYYYERNSYSVTLNKETGIDSVTGNGTYKYGANVTINAILSNGYQWKNWNGTYNTDSQGYSFIMPASNVTNTANAEIINYNITYNLNGGNVTATNPTSYNVTTNTFTLNNPIKTGYDFLGWTGSNGTTNQKTVSVIKGSTGNKTYTANWKINKYPVTYIDKNSSGTELGRTTKQIDYNATVRGEDLGSSTADNAYYNQYRYVSDTSATVTTSGATVYRIFEFCKTEANSNLQWNDNNNSDGFRPNKYKLKLKQNGIIINEVELSSDTTHYTFPDLPKYDTIGNPYQYTFDVDATERYEISFDDAGNLIVEDYQPANFSVTIPKKITLDGNTGEANYTVSVNGTFYYNDTLTVKPNDSFTLTDRSNISTMTGYVNQVKTGFTKEDLPSLANGGISVNRTNFAGLWQGSFNFEIKFKMQN